MPDNRHQGAASQREPLLGIALQAEHDDPAQKAAAPLLALLSWADQPDGALHLAQGQPALAGYGGDVSVAGLGDAAHFVVSATRGNCLARYRLDGRFIAAHALADAGALAQSSATVWAGGRADLARLPQDAAEPCALTPAAFGQLDNHWLKASLKQALSALQPTDAA